MERDGEEGGGDEGGGEDFFTFVAKQPTKRRSAAK